MLQLDFILCALTASAIPAGFSDRLKMALHDAALPQESHAQTRGRDTQCELYVAAVCARAGLLPTLDEPDINCCHAGLTYGIEASEQICRCGLPGIIVIDLSLANNGENFPVTLPLSDAQYEQAAKELIRRFIDNQFLKLTERVRGKNVQGLILLNHDIRQQANGGWGLDSATMATHLSPYNGRRRRIVDGFFKQFMKGLATSS
jgi:hypothetical protein